MSLLLSQVRASPFNRRLADWSGRIEFVILRTTSSLPVALHLASWQRSYGSLQAGVGMPEKDLHLFDLTRLLAHGCPVKLGDDSGGSA